MVGSVAAGFRLTVALWAGACLSACDQPLAPRVRPRPAVNAEIEAAAAAVSVDPAETAAAQAMLKRLVAQWNTPGSTVRQDVLAVAGYTQRAARAAEAERGGGGTTNVAGLLARSRRAAVAAAAGDSTAAGGVVAPR